MKPSLRSSFTRCEHGTPLIQVIRGLPAAGQLQVAGQLPGGRHWSTSLDLAQAAPASGLNRQWARGRIDELTAPSISDAQVAQARAEEQNLRLSGVRAQLLELRLRDLGYNPGRLDGVIDGNTRNAILAYQEAEGVTATGYVDRATAVGLMTGSISITVPGR